MKKQFADIGRLGSRVIGGALGSFVPGIGTAVGFTAAGALGDSLFTEDVETTTHFDFGTPDPMKSYIPGYQQDSGPKKWTSNRAASKSVLDGVMDVADIAAPILGGTGALKKFDAKMAGKASDFLGIKKLELPGVQSVAPETEIPRVDSGYQKTGDTFIDKIMSDINTFKSADTNAPTSLSSTLNNAPDVVAQSGDVNKNVIPKFMDIWKNMNDIKSSITNLHKNKY